MEWFVFPVEGGLELVVDSTDELVLEQAIAAVAVSHPDYLIAKEWVLETGDVISLVPAPVEAVPSQLSAVPQQQSRSVEEQKSRAAHPAGKGRKI